MATKWTTPHSYDHKKLKVSWKEKRKNPEKYGLTKESVLKKTVPGQTISIRELVQRQKNGRPQPITETE